MRAGKRMAAAVAALAALTTLSATASAHVRSMSPQEIADHAAAVVVVRVDAAHSEATRSAAGDIDAIETELSLTVLERWKGAARSTPAAFELTLPGGTVEGPAGVPTTLRVCCAPPIEAGKTYVLFLLPEWKTFPTVGFGQGVFEIHEDERGERRVHASGGAAVTAVSAGGVETASAGAAVDDDGASAGGSQLRSSGGGVRLSARQADQAAAGPQAMTLAAFAEAWRPLLETSRGHEVEGVVARRAVVRYEATVLVGAAGDSGDPGEMPAECEAEHADATEDDAASAEDAR